MSQWYCLIGTTPALSLLELKSVMFRDQSGEVGKLITPDIVEIRLKSGLNPQVFLDQLGGTVKILKEIARALDVQSLITIVAGTAELYDQKAFAISASSDFDDLKSTAQALKKRVQTNGHRFRFRLLSHVRESSGILSEYKELIFVKSGEDFVCLQTMAVQSIRKWTIKDFGRPQADPKSGMLPPKIARMMINCALHKPISSITTVYDPFCGSGTILTEALDLGVSVIGSDIDAKAVASASHNVQWLKNTFPVAGKSTLFVSDLLTVTPKQVGQEVDAVVFEGFLGPPNIRPDQIKRYHQGLRKFYIGVIKHIHKLLKPGGRLVSALPEYHQPSIVKSYHDLIDSCENYGYTQIGDTVTYGRTHAVVKRTISVLQKI